MPPTDQKALAGRDAYQPRRNTPTFYPTANLANVAIHCNIYKHVIKYKDILYGDNNCNDIYTIINTNLTISISTYHLNQYKADARCARLYFFIISIVYYVCSHLQRSKVKKNVWHRYPSSVMT